MSIKEGINKFRALFPDHKNGLVAVSKTKPIADLMEAYEAGQRIFGENKVQEMVDKYEQLPKDIRWHMIGHLQRNKVKYIAPFVDLIHSVDSYRLLKEINKQGAKFERKIPVLLQIHIAREETKFGLSEEEVKEIIQGGEFEKMEHVFITGLMGMATFTENMDTVRKEFKYLRSLFEQLKENEIPGRLEMNELSMGMTNDYEIALEEGSTLIRIGSAIFGARNYESA